MLRVRVDAKSNLLRIYLKSWAMIRLGAVACKRSPREANFSLSPPPSIFISISLSFSLLALLDSNSSPVRRYYVADNWILTFMMTLTIEIDNDKIGGEEGKE